MTRLNAAKAVMDEAAQDIQNLFSACSTINISRTIQVGWQSHGGNTLATGGLSGGMPFMNWDQDNSSSFFVDTSPADESEFSAFPNDQRTINGGQNVNVEDRHYSNFLGTSAASNSDMLSVATHELMHSLGVLSSNLAALNTDADAELDLLALGNEYDVEFSGGHTTETLPWDGPGSLNGDYYPNVIGPSIISGTRGLLTDIDALLLANVLGISGDDFACVSQPHNTIMAVPEPSAFLAVGLICLACCMSRYRRVHALLEEWC
jgi:hypothetical protein